MPVGPYLAVSLLAIAGTSRWMIRRRNQALSASFFVVLLCCAFFGYAGYAGLSVAYEALQDGKIGLLCRSCLDSAKVGDDGLLYWLSLAVAYAWGIIGASLAVFVLFVRRPAKI